MVPKYIDAKYLKRIEDEIKKRMGNKNSCNITMKDTGDELIIARNADGYTMYNGCELIIGDTSLKVISGLIAKGDVRP